MKSMLPMGAGGSFFHSTLRSAAIGVLLFSSLSLLHCDLRAADPGSGEIAVSCVAMKGYARKKNTDGSFKRETYVLAEGGIWPGDSIDPSFDAIKFKDIINATTGPLRKQNYLPARTVEGADILIKIFWGSTARDTRYSSRYEQNLEEVRNAIMMGYDDELRKFYELRGTALGWTTLTSMDELTDATWGRYFVVLVAYDYQRLKKAKTEKPLWMTKFSFSERHTAFNQALPGMMLKASHYFGSPTKGLIHRDFPEGNIETGEIKVLPDNP